MNKLNAKSDLLRIEGNKFFYEKSYLSAMLKYNESLCFAEPNSETMGLAYANRSAIYFEMKIFEKCARNITLAKQNSYPEVNSEILNKRREKCLTEALRQTNCAPDINQFFKLSYPSHKKIPHMVDCLELKHDSTYGRHIVTNKSLKVGDIVFIEKPFCKIVQNDFIHQICSWCFNSNQLDLMPCRMCTKGTVQVVNSLVDFKPCGSDVWALLLVFRDSAHTLLCSRTMFCSDECETKANQSFHKYECLCNEVTASLSSNLQMALRTFFQTLSMFGESLDDLQKYLLEHPNPCTVFDVEDADERSTFLAINSLLANEQISIKNTIFEKIFQMSPKLEEMWSKHGAFIANFLKRQMQIATLNYHEVYFWPLKKGRVQDPTTDQLAHVLAYQRGTVAVGSGSYPLASLLNHHCAPNVIRTFIDDKLVLVVQRPIKKGDQLFDNYGYHFTNVSKHCRQMELLKQYRFKCVCDACKNDWPFLSDLKVSDRVCLNKAKKFCRELKLTDLNRKKAIVKYRELCEFIEKNHKNFPSLEACSIMQSAAAYLEMILKPPVQFS